MPSVTIARVFGLFIIASFSFIVAISWSNFIDIIFNKVRLIDLETGSDAAVIGEALIFSIIITGIAIVLIYFLYMYGYLETDRF